MGHNGIQSIIDLEKRHNVIDQAKIENIAFMVKIVANGYREPWATCEAFRRVFGLEPNEITVSIYLDDYISKEEFYHCQSKARENKEYAIPEKKKEICMAYPLWVGSTGILAGVSDFTTADNACLAKEAILEIPDYESYLKLTRRICIKDVIESEAFRDSLEEDLLVRALDKCKSWERDYKSRTRSTLESIGRPISDTELDAIMHKEYPLMVYIR